jgi:mono/diheme cytochrome c family protein
MKLGATREAICGLGLTLLLAVGACGGGEAPSREWTPADHGQPSADDMRSPEPEATPPGAAEDPNARAARALWNATCASCHGRDGRGQGSAPPPGARMPDFATAEWQGSRSDAQLGQVIREGRGMMPAFGKQVNEQGIAALVQHIRSFGADERPAGGQPPEPAAHGTTDN